jgi:outer membrane protein OmpA-like peptidoglycan-associated protein
MPHEGTFGFSYERRSASGMEFLLGAEARIRFAGMPRGGVGFESVRPAGPYRLALRGGGRLGGETGGLPLSLGASFGRTTGRSVLWLDYAYEPAGVLGSVHRVGLRTSFEKPYPPPQAWLQAPVSFVAGREAAPLRLSAGGGARIRRWELVVTGADGRRAASWQGRRRPPPEVSWAGEDAPAGLYDAELVVVDEKGRAARSPLRSIRLVREEQPQPPPTQPMVTWRVPYVIPADLLFASGSHFLRPEAAENLERVVQSIVASYRDLDIWVLGHTDNQAPKAGSPYKDNNDLSLLRAGEVRRYLQQRLGYGEGRIQVWGLGESQPIGDNLSEEGKTRNRRVEIVVVTTQIVPLSRALIAAATYETRGDSAQALALLRAALEAAPDRPEVHRQLGALLYGLGAREDAFRYLRRALELNPGDTVLRDWLTRAGGF